jgi:signal transduction histidine kinase/DNA-binding response OmpR family regulator
MGWAERLAQERRARLAAERLLEHKQRNLTVVQRELDHHARGVTERILAQCEAASSARSEADSFRDRHSRTLAELERAHAAAVTAERRLWTSIEAIRDGFAVFDADHRLLGANRAWLRAFRSYPEVRRGIGYRRLLEVCALNRLVELGEENPADWVARMRARWDARRIPPQVIQFRDGPWVKLIDRRTRHGDMVCLALDITETVAFEARLEKERARAEAANRAKSAFLANMSHEIRTPMNGIVGMAELLCGTELNEEQRLYAETIRSSGEALLQIINDVLDYSRIESQRLALHPEPFDLERCIHEVVALMQPGAQARGLAMVIDYDLFLPTRFLGDAGRIRQVLSNLLGNAVKFTRAGTITLRVTGMIAEDGRQRLHLAVEDTGIGIAAEHLDHVFGAFNQVESETNRKFEGTGLGLAITRQLIALMGGEVWVESEEGRGSCFGFRLSLPVAEEVTDPPRRPEGLTHALVVDDRLVNRAILERQLTALGIAVTLCHSADEALEAIAAGCPADLVITDHEPPGLDGLALAEALRARDWQGPILLLTPNPAAIRVADAAALSLAVLQEPALRRDLMRRLAELAPVAPPPQAAPERAEADPETLRAMRVLSAEDNRTNQLVLAKMVKDLDVDLAFADNGRIAVAMFESFRPDLIFMDISMPEMDGCEATRAIRALEAGSGRHVPIVALTAHAMEGDADGILSAGLDDYLTKPLRRAAIAGAILAHVPPDARPPSQAQPVATAPDVG